MNCGLNRETSQFMHPYAKGRDGHPNEKIKKWL